MPELFSITRYAGKIKYRCFNLTLFSCQHDFASLKINIFGISIKFPRLINLRNLKKHNPLENHIFPKPHHYVVFDYERSVGNGRQSVNLGDYVQTIATENAIRQIDRQAVFTIQPRDRQQDYAQTAAVSIMQGWFAHQNNFLPAPALTPVFVGMHLADKAQKYISFLIKNHREYWQNADIGCRDESTLNFFQKHNIPAYFSRCLTLTLPLRTETPAKPEIFLVNLDDDVFELLPENIKKQGRRINQREIGIDKELPYQHYHQQAENLLEMYKKRAGLVISSAIHCANPCTAMGIPTVLIYKHQEQLNRFSTIKNLLPLYSLEDVKNNLVNWQPQTPDIEDLKKLMLQNLELSVQKALNQKVDNAKLHNIRKQIAGFNCLKPV